MTEENNGRTTSEKRSRRMDCGTVDARTSNASPLSPTSYSGFAANFATSAGSTTGILGCKRPADLWLWMRPCYVIAVLMMFRRECDGQPNAVNLRTLLKGIE
jgi:hypothetical protein